MIHKVSHIIPGIFCLIVCILSYFTLVSYPGNASVYVIFTILLNALFIFGFTRDKIYFDTFIGVFFWLGFWLKLSVRVAFLGGEFQEPIGQFNGTGAAFDHALLVTSCGVFALLIASLIRRRFIFSYKDVVGQPRHESTFSFYQKHREHILVAFLLLFIVVAVTNVIFGIYQRGTIPRKTLPLGLSGVYTWFLLFGLASVSAVIMDCEFRLKINPYLASIIGFLECFFSNVSMLSRGMVLNGGALIIGLIDSAKRRSIHTSLRYALTVSVIFVVLFISSVFAVNHIRKGLFFSYSPAETTVSIHAGESMRPVLSGEKIGPAQSLPGQFISRTFLSEPIANTITGIKVLLIDRWVGIEGVMAVSSYTGLGWDLWKKAWQEKYSHSGTSMFDQAILKYKYLSIHLSKHHFINIPGIVAFFYYLGSLPFLFFSMLLLGFLAAGIEMFVYKLSGANIILCSLMGQVVAYRYAHFGYVPAQSYLLFGSLFLNVLLIYFFDRYLSYRERKRLQQFQ